MKYDIIIPCYNSHKTIERTLASVLMQTKIEDIQVTLVNDAGENYYSIIDKFRYTGLDIREISYDKNGGPAKARNFGLENSSNPYLMFIDSDDCLATPHSVEILSYYLDQKNINKIAIANFEEEKAFMQYKLHEKDTTFTHGKMYKREYLDKYKIRFNNSSRCCEDMSFNLLALLCLDHVLAEAVFVEKVLYYWLNNSNSIGRSNPLEYRHNTCVLGFIENLIYLFNEISKRGIDTPHILKEKIASMQRCCLMYSEHLNYPEWEPSNREALIKFYKEIYQPVENKISDELFNDIALKTYKYKDDPNLAITAIKQIIQLLKNI